MSYWEDFKNSKLLVSEDTSCGPQAFHESTSLASLVVWGVVLTGIPHEDPMGEKFQMGTTTEERGMVLV